MRPSPPIDVFNSIRLLVPAQVAAGTICISKRAPLFHGQKRRTLVSSFPRVVLLPPGKPRNPALSRISPVTIPTSEPQPPLCRNLPLPPTLPPLSDYCIPLPLCVRFVCIRVIHFPRNISSCAAWIATRTAKRPSPSSTRCVSTLLHPFFPIVYSFLSLS